MIEDSVREIIKDLFLRGNGSLFVASTDLLSAGICDSLGMMELAAEMEARFPGIRVDDQEITPDNLGSVDRIVAYLRTKGVT